MPQASHHPWLPGRQALLLFCPRQSCSEPPHSIGLHRGSMQSQGHCDTKEIKAIPMKGLGKLNIIGCQNWEGQITQVTLAIKLRARVTEPGRTPCSRRLPLGMAVPQSGCPGNGPCPGTVLLPQALQGPAGFQVPCRDSFRALGGAQPKALPL